MSNTTATTEDNRARAQAIAQVASIRELVERLEAANTAREYGEADSVREEIMEDPLSVQVREDWHAPGEVEKPAEFEILLCTGGPAVRIVGDLDCYAEPSRPRVQFQDWGTPWTELFELDGEDREALLAYCQQFYFGE